MKKSETIFVKHIHKVSFVVHGKTYGSIATYYNSGIVGYKKKSLHELVQFLYETNPELIDELKSIHFDEILITNVLWAIINDDQMVRNLCHGKWYECMLRLLQNEAECHDRIYVLK
jgi:hypothetical protein